MGSGLLQNNSENCLLKGKYNKKNFEQIDLCGANYRNTYITTITLGMTRCFPHFQVSIAAKKLGFQIRLVKRAGCMFSAANQTPTAGVENGNKDQIPLHSMIGLNDGFT